MAKKKTAKKKKTTKKPAKKISKKRKPKKTGGIKKPSRPLPQFEGPTIKGPQFKNKYGYFTEDGREYVITNPNMPRPWVNVVCNGNFGFVVSQNGSGYTWKGNSQLSRITRWEQDLIKDDWGKYFYVRDNQTKEIWSPTKKPCDPNFDKYEVRHGLGYSVIRSSYKGVGHEITQFVSRTEPVEILKVTITNEKRNTRKLSLFNYFEWALGSQSDIHREFHKTFIQTAIDSEHNAIFGTKRPGLMPGSLGVSTKEKALEGFVALTNASVKGYEGDKEAFFGRYGTNARPKAVLENKLKNTEGKWNDSIAALQTETSLKAGESKTFIFLIGAPDTKEEAYKIIKRYNNLEAVEFAFSESKSFWNEIVEDCFIETPDVALNFMTNIWLKYQAISARIWARTGYYQCSGAFGFRDQLQDSQVFLPLDPRLTRKQILLHAEQQFSDGTVYHWWHPGTNIACHTDMTDDLLWLPFIALNYLDETGDNGVMDEEAPYVTDKDGTQEKGTVYNHCTRAIDRVLARWSDRGLPLIGEGDWNDGMSHVGVQWKGESIWLGHFLYGVLNRFARLSEKRGDRERARHYLERAKDLKEAINEHGWDGEWYIRATRDNGKPLGSSSEEEGKIYLNAQTWAVINGTATEARAKKCMAAAEKFLYREYGPILFTPGYSKTDPTIGYLSRYAPSIRENGGLYTHAATWGVQAQCALGNGDKAYKAYTSMCPILRGTDPDHYYCEPYVTPGNVDGPDSPNFGRGGWTWYTGSATWMFKVAIDWMLGVRATQEGLVIDPCIPKKWKGFRIKRIFRESVYNIEVINPKHVEKGVKEIIIDGVKVKGNVLKLHKDHLELR